MRAGGVGSVKEKVARRDGVLGERDTSIFNVLGKGDSLKYERDRYGWAMPSGKDLGDIRECHTAKTRGDVPSGSGGQNTFV